MLSHWILLWTAFILMKTASTIINCKMARQFCVEDAACHSITTIIPRLCGQELVACSTVTVTKCQAALRTLVAFQHFQPTCLCREPRVDPECNTYRNLVFDHPCFSVQRKDNDPYPVHALPTCGYALEVCRQETSCSRLYDNFVNSCSYDNTRCKMTDSSACYEAWSQLRLSPVFGCICPGQERDCEDIFNVVHKNPCVDLLPQHSHNSSSHSTRYRLHRLLNPPPSPLYPRQPRPQHRHAPGTLGPARTRTVATSSGPTRPAPAASPGRFSVGVLGSANVSHPDRRRDPLLLSPLYDSETEGTPGAEAHQAGRANMERTLYGERDNAIYRVNPPPSYHVISEEVPRREDVLQSTCHVAKDNCLRDPDCRSKLQPVLQACDPSTCNRKICMQRLQDFYAEADRNMTLEVAFCVCRRRPSGPDECLKALEELHPSCAQRSETGIQPTCNSLAERCLRQDRRPEQCRFRLEHFQQDCAVDSVTGRCSGPPSRCRHALLAILGSELRTTCACEGTDMASMAACRAWHRLFWENSCVLEAQRQYHEQRKGPPYQGTTTAVPTPRPPYVVAPPYAPPSTPRQRPVTTTTTSTTTTTTQVRWARPPQYGVVTTLRPSTTRRAPTVGRKLYCTSRKPGRPDDHIPAGSGIRYYTADGSSDDQAVGQECSELCMCHVHNQEAKLSCNLLDCIEKKACRTPMAQYPHGSAGLIAYREGCICYHGDFICMRPPADQYTLEFGVFLFLGYSAKDEEILKERTKMNVREHTVQQLEKMLQITMAQNGESFRDWPCRLQVDKYFQVYENIIIQAKMDAVEKSYSNNSLDPEALRREKEECSRPLRDISFKVNNRAPEILSHPLLSVFKMADMEITIPEPSAGPSRRPSALLLLTALPISALLALVT